MKHGLTIEQKIVSSDKFLAWLKKKYPVPNVEVVVKYTAAPFIRNVATFASLWPTGPRSAKIEISIGRPTPEVLRSIAHEWKHVIQLYKEHIPVEKIKYKHELEAMGFSTVSVARYFTQVGEDW